MPRFLLLSMPVAIVLFWLAGCAAAPDAGGGAVGGALGPVVGSAIPFSYR